MHNTEEKNYIFGIRSIIEAVEAGKTIDKLFIQKGLHNDLFAELWKLVRVKRINYKHVPLEKINRLTRKNHQGVICYISPIPYQPLDEIIQRCYENGKDPIVLILDRITDTRNFGAITRVAEAAQVDAIIIPDKGGALITSDAVKTSAGALNYVSVCKVKSLKNTINQLKESGLNIVSCYEKAKDSIFSIDYLTPTAIIIGSEKNGISSSLLDLSDNKVKIPMYGQIDSLNVSTSTSIILYELIRQRTK